MTDAFIYTAFIFFASIFYIPSFLSRRYLSGKRFSPFIFWITMAYNVALGSIHAKFIKFSTLPFFGIVDNSIFGWLSYLFIFAHAFSVPSPKERESNSNKAKITPYKWKK